MVNAIIFDLGAVLIDWNPKYLYSKLFETESEMDHFFENICTSEWNEEQDAGRPLEVATQLLVQQYPQHEEYIRAYYGRWEEMIGGAIEGTVEIFQELKGSGKFKFYALTNWSAETFPVAQRRFDFLNWFDGIVVSGTEKNRKPFPEFYHLLLNRYSLNARECLFIDDNLRNVEAAREIGMQVIHFISPEQLKEELTKRVVL